MTGQMWRVAKRPAALPQPHYGERNIVLGRQAGLAIGVVLASLLLMVLMGTAIVYSTRTGALTSGQQTDRQLAVALIQQAANFKTGFNLLQAHGIAIQNITLDSTGNTGLYDPVNGALPPQVPPRNAMYTADTAVNSWVYELDGSKNPMVKLNSIGTTAAEYVIAVGPIYQGMCQQIDQILLGTTAYGVDGTYPLANWMTRPSSTLIDLSGNAAMNRPEQCIQTQDGYYVYYVTLKAG